MSKKPRLQIGRITTPNEGSLNILTILFTKLFTHESLFTKFYTKLSEKIFKTRTEKGKAILKAKRKAISKTQSENKNLLRNFIMPISERTNPIL